MSHRHQGNPTRVCMYAPAADGGHARYVCELLSALAQHDPAGWRYELMSSEDLEKQFHSGLYRVHALLPALRHRGSFASPLAWGCSRLTHYARRDASFLRWLRGRPDIDVVHFQQWTLWLAAPLVRRVRAMGKRVMFTVHNVVPHRYPRFVPRGLLNHWIRRACRECDGLFVHTDTLAGELSRFLGRPHPPIHVSPHGVWSRPAGDAPTDPDALKQRLLGRRLLFFGSIRRNKGLDLLLRAAAQLPRSYAITVAGEPLDAAYFADEIVPLTEELRAAGMKVELHARFIADDELPALFAGHSAVVLPYTPEFVAQSGVAFMALAHGLPVVASGAGGLASLMREFEVGVTFSAATTEALAAAVRQLHEAHDPPTLARAIAAAREKYSWRAAAAATVRGYRAALTPQLEFDDRVVGTTTAC